MLFLLLLSNIFFGLITVQTETVENLNNVRQGLMVSLAKKNDNSNNTETVQDVKNEAVQTVAALLYLFFACARVCTMCEFVICINEFQLTI